MGSNDEWTREFRNADNDAADVGRGARPASRNVSERDQQLYDYGRSGYRLAASVTVPGSDVVTVIDTLTGESELGAMADDSIHCRAGRAAHPARARHAGSDRRVAGRRDRDQATHAQLGGLHPTRPRGLTVDEANEWR